MSKLTGFFVKNGYKATCNHYRKLVYPLFLTLLVLLLTSPVQAKYSGGTGEPNNPYQIADANDMNEVGTHTEDWDSHFILVNDINLADYTGYQFNIIGNDSNTFTGIFDGQGYEIANFTFNSTYTDNIGLFRYIDGENANIKNLGLINPNIDAGTGQIIGSLVGSLKNGSITGCYVEGGSVSGGKLVGGLVGVNQVGTISNCYATGSVTDTDLSIGGLVGQNGGVISNCYASCSVITAKPGYSPTRGCGGLVGYNKGTITDCSASGNIEGIEGVFGGLVGINGFYNDYWANITNCYATGRITVESLAGGLVGRNDFGTILNCFATGDVTAIDTNPSFTQHAGGLVGLNKAAITYSYSHGDVLGEDAVGGLVGANYDFVGLTTVSNCYAGGNVSGTGNSEDTSVGGLVGYSDAEIINCYAMGKVSGPENSHLGGLIGWSSTSATTDSFWDTESSQQTWSDGGTGLMTAEMQTESTFTSGWLGLCS